MSEEALPALFRRTGKVPRTLNDETGRSSTTGVGLAAESAQPSELRTINLDALKSGFRKGASSILEK